MEHEFWTLPLDNDAADDTTSTSTTDRDQQQDDGDYDEPIYEILKGYDHRAEVAAYRERRIARPRTPPASSASATSPPRRRSWLLGFALPGKMQSQSDLLRRSYDEEDDDEDDDDSLPGMASSSDDSSSEADDSSLSSSKSSRGVTFAPSVLVHPIPRHDELSDAQRRRMYSSSIEVRRNKMRNKREYRYDGCDWRNATEEWEMGVDMVTGELVHPVHEYGMSAY